MDWLKKHTDAAIVVGTILSSVIWMNTKFNSLEKDMAIIKTVLIMKNIMPAELAKVEPSKD